MKSSEAIIQLFNQKGLKITPQRRLIFELLAEDESHPTAEELYQLVISRMPDVSQTTVYNTLRELVALGELAPVENLSEAGARFDTNTSNHHHLFCMHCHTLVDIEQDFPDVELTLEEAKGYQIVKNQVTFYGICQECQKI
ncbi:MAG: transcriptional repressor [Anaerolineales bacterium]|nr:transcriptional repressor [Anaerolineales bacterium]